MSAENTPRQTSDRPWLWKPGQSGNPGGRPQALKDVRDLARAHTPKAIERLAAMLDHEDGRVVVAAATSLLDRAWGRPEQSVVADVSVTSSVDVEALRATLEARLARLVAGQVVEALPAAEPVPALPEGEGR